MMRTHLCVYLWSLQANDMLLGTQVRD